MGTPAPVVLERPVRCWGDPASVDECATEAVVVLVQLRPDASGRPVVFVTAGCFAHHRAIRTYLTESWSADPVTSLGVTDADYWLSQLLDEYQADGVGILTSSGVA